MHQSWITGDDDDEAMAVVLHPLQQCLDRLGPEVLAQVVSARQRIRLVDEQDAVERAANRAVRLDRRRTDILANETCTVDLDEMAALEQSGRAIHLRQESSDRRLPRPRIAEEDKMLGRRHFGESLTLALGLHL